MIDGTPARLAIAISTMVASFERCLELGVRLVFETDVADDQALAAQYNADLVVASDGINSRIRNRYSDTFQPDVDSRQCRFVWLGTKKKFDAFTFAFEETPHGWFQAHCYQYDGDTSTFIVETPEEVWRASGLDEMSQEEVAEVVDTWRTRYRALIARPEVRAVVVFKNFGSLAAIMRYLQERL